MRTDRTRPTRTNGRLRRLSQRFAFALHWKVSHAEREEAFQAQYAPIYRDFGRRVAAADRARAQREGDHADDDAEIVLESGRLIVVRGWA